MSTSGGDIPANQDADDSAATVQAEEHAEELAETVIRLDPRDLNSIIQAVKAQTPSTSQVPTATHAFKRKGFARQFDFNNDIIRKLTPLQNVEGVSLVILEVIQDLTVRNETLKIADSYPQVFQFLDIKKKSEALKSMDSKLGEFMDITRKDQESTRKRKQTSAMPFRGRETAWRPFPPLPARQTATFPTGAERPRDRRPYSYSRRDLLPSRNSREYRNYYKEEENRRKTSCNLCGREGHWAKECPGSQ